MPHEKLSIFLFVSQVETLCLIELYDMIECPQLQFTTCTMVSMELVFGDMVFLLKCSAVASHSTFK